MFFLKDFQAMSLDWIDMVVPLFFEPDFMDGDEQCKCN